MEGILEIRASSHPTNEAYVKYAESQIKSIVQERLQLLGIQTEDMMSDEHNRKWRIAKAKQVGDTEIHEAYSAMGIILVEISWTMTDVMIRTPYQDPNYGNSKLWLQHFDHHIKQFRENNGS